MSNVGFIVRGVSSAAFESAKIREAARFERREKEREDAKSKGIRMPRKFKLKDIKVEKMYHQIIFGPTFIESSANDAVELAKRSGFLDVQIGRSENEA